MNIISFKYIISTRSSLAKKDESSLPPRRVHAKRRSKSRASASPGRGPLNNGLMAAAWPKTQSYRAIKTKTQGDTGSQGWITGDRIFTLMDQVEEMEVCEHHLVFKTYFQNILSLIKLTFVIVLSIYNIMCKTYGKGIAHRLG